MSQEVLVLNSDYEPLNVCNLRRAIILVYLGKADILHARDEEMAAAAAEGLSSLAGRTMLETAEGESIAAPSVVKLRHHVKRPLPELKLSRRSVFARDNFTCQYCGSQGKDLTIDHVVPKRHGGGMQWENLVACCRRCNTKKGDKTPEKVGMKLLRAPRRPRYTPYISLNKYVAGTKHVIWRDYLPIFTDIPASAAGSPGAVTQ
ncbi:MAG: HNH endonuclease [Cytophagales bacterium]|nr:HNH endonuclease [Armatimonadota bacterium]